MGQISFSIVTFESFLQSFNIFLESDFKIKDHIMLILIVCCLFLLMQLHCLGVLLDHQKTNPYIYVKDKYSLILNLIAGLQLASEEVQGEVLFLLYKISLLQDEYKDCSVANALIENCRKLLHLSLEALMKTQSDDVRMNCIALLTVLAQKGWFQMTCLNDLDRKNSFQADNFMQTDDQIKDGPALNSLFAEAIKGPLLSSDSQVQVAAVDLIFLYLSWGGGFQEVIEELVQENVADYVFEILRLSSCKDPLVNSCIQVLNLLSTSEEAFRQRLAIGFTTLVQVLCYVAEVPLHPSLTHSLKLVGNCVSNNPGIVSNCHIAEVAEILIKMLKKYAGGSGILPETFNLACSTLVALMKCSSSNGTSSFLIALCDAARCTLISSLTDYDKCPEQFLYSLYLLKEAYIYSYQGNFSGPVNIELRSAILDICKVHVLPWFMIAINTIENEDTILAVIETFHSILLQDSDTEIKILIDTLVSSSWFSFLFGCLGMFPSERMKYCVYLMFGSIVDVLLGSDCGQIIKDAALNLPSDPVDSLFLLGQNSSHNLQMSTCQSAVLLILYVSSLYDDRLADDKLVLASIEQFILLNGSEILYGPSPVRMDLLINLYGLYRGIAKLGYQIPYSPDAEKILFHLLDEKDWDLIRTRVHFLSLKWLFQQERIFKSLSEQMVKLCQSNKSEGSQIVISGKNSCKIEVRSIAELIISGDNFAAMIFVFLLGELVEELGREDDIISVVNTITEIIEIQPSASDQMSIHGLAGTLQKLCDHSVYSYPDIFMATCQLAFIFLRSVQSKLLSNDEVWVAMIIKLIDYLTYSAAKDSWSQQSLVVVGILVLVLHHSTNQVLIEASKVILLSNLLASVLNKTITEACPRGPALTDQDEETRTGEILLFLLLLMFFSFRGAEAVLPGMSGWHELLNNDIKKKQFLTYNSVRCHDFCTLLHFGSPLIKLVSSYCLLELFERISDDESIKLDGLRIKRGNLLSIMAILEGLIYSSDVTVSTNCSLCLSMLIGWEELHKELSSVKRSYWCRVIVEELAMSLAVPHMASKSFIMHHRPAVHVAVALLKLKKVPPWMTSVFDSSCISSIIQNMSTSYMCVELVILLRELLNAGFIDAEQVASLNRVFQIWRKHLYADDSQNYNGKDREIVAADADDLGKVFEFLLKLMSSLSSHDKYLGQVQCANRWLLAEIELFSNCVANKHKA